MSKMLGGGADRFNLKPLSPEGNRDGDDNPELDNLMGCHTGTAYGLNITNPQPGYVYKWPRNKARDINYYRRLGYTVVNAEDPEWSVGSKVPGDLERHVQVAFVFVVSRCLHEMLRMKTISDLVCRDGSITVMGWTAIVNIAFVT